MYRYPISLADASSTIRIEPNPISESLPLLLFHFKVNAKRQKISLLGKKYIKYREDR